MQTRLDGNAVLCSRDPSVVLTKACPRSADGEPAPGPGDGKVSLCLGAGSWTAASQEESAVPLAGSF